MSWWESILVSSVYRPYSIFSRNPPTATPPPFSGYALSVWLCLDVHNGPNLVHSHQQNQQKNIFPPSLLIIRFVSKRQWVKTMGESGVSFDKGKVNVCGVEPHSKGCTITFFLRPLPMTQLQVYCYLSVYIHIQTK